MSQASKPIALFDSGVGGLTVFKALQQILPQEDYLYLGDTARLPYGSKSTETVIRYALQATAKLVSQDIKLLVVACNTATAAALPKLQQAYPQISVIGVIEPGAKAAIEKSPQGKIAIIGTESTVNNQAYPQAIARLKPNIQTKSLACPLFVPMAEEGWFQGDLVEAIIRHYLEPLLTPFQPDCLVLGCTHYPLLKTAIQKVVGSLTLVDSAATTALAVQDCLQHLNLFNPQTDTGQVKFFTTDDSRRFAQTGSLFLGMNIDPNNVFFIDL